MDLQLNGKLALVSGSTAGIGHAIARTLAAEGAHVIVNGRSQAAVDEAAERIRSETQGTVLCYTGDLSKAEAATELVHRHPGIDILVKNLGLFEAKAFEDIPDEDWQRFFNVNVLSGVRLARLVLPHMKQGNLGTDHLHLERERGANPDRDDPLRHDQDRATCGFARASGVGRRHGHHGQ